MKKVLIVSISLDEQKSLIEAAGVFSNREYSIATTSSFGQEAVWWETSGPDALVLSLPPDEEMQTYYLVKLQEDVPRALPIIVLSAVINPGLMGLSQLFQNLRMVKTPASGPGLFKMLVELTTDYGANKRQNHPRYLTEQTILVLDEFQGLSFQATMKNLSVSGVYFEAPSLEKPLKQDDVIKMSIQIGSPSKDYSFDGKIVWTKNLSNGSCGFGVTFIDKEEVYNNLLKGF